ncbi:MAG: hypothetical protein KKI12_11525 [Proteobacteria bacterium]|nr:hypothetical protein [Pseudomonadota bacterium]
MNSKQKPILLAFVIVSVGMMLYPPFHIVIKGTEMNMGYGFLFDPPQRGYLGASVNVAVLLAQWVVAILVGAAGWFLTKSDENSVSIEPRERNPENKSFVESASFLFLRLFRGIVGFIFGWQVIGLFPVATWVSNPSAITGNMVAMVVLKVVIMVIAGAIFFGVRKYIHWLHKRWYGIPHPALSKAMAL